MTDLGSTNGTWLNRAQLRPRTDTHIRPGDLLCLASGLAFRLVGLDPAAFASPIQRGAGLLPAAQSVGDARDEFTLDARSAAIAQDHQQLLARTRCNVHNGRNWLQVRSLPRTCSLSCFLVVRSYTRYDKISHCSG